MGQTRAKLGQHWSTLGPTPPISLDLGRNWFDFGPRPISIIVGPNRPLRAWSFADFDQRWPGIDQLWSAIQQISPSSTKFGPLLTKVLLRIIPFAYKATSRIQSSHESIQMQGAPRDSEHVWSFRGTPALPFHGAPPIALAVLARRRIPSSRASTACRMGIAEWAASQITRR